MNITHQEATNKLNKIFPGIRARCGYIGNCSPCGTRDDRCFRIWTTIDTGDRYCLSMDIPTGKVSAAVMVGLIRKVLRFSKLRTTPAVAQMLSLFDQ